MKCNETQGKWCKNKHRASKIIDTFETYHVFTRGPYFFSLYFLMSGCSMADDMLMVMVYRGDLHEEGW
jgi:hypothetical protein